MSTSLLTVPPDTAFVGLARLVISQAARQAGVGQERVEDVKIAVAEAVGSAVRVRLAAGSSAPVDIAFGVAAHAFEVTVRGLEDPLSLGADQTAGVGADGLDPKLGLTLIEGLTDGVDYMQDGQLVDLRFVVALEAR